MLIIQHSHKNYYYCSTCQSPVMSWIRGIPLRNSQTQEIHRGKAQILQIQRLRPYYQYPTDSGEIDERRSPYFYSYEMTLYLRHVEWIARVNFNEPCWRFAVYLHAKDRDQELGESAWREKYKVVGTLDHTEQTISLWSIYQYGHK